jgi:alpha-L-fucosidase
MLVDIVSKNGNMLLNIPVRGDGTIDDKEIAILEGIAAWMDINKESIFDTRPWKIYGEGPVAETVNPINAQGFNEGKTKYSDKDIRFNQKGKILYATVMGVPSGVTIIKSLGTTKGNGKVKRIEMLGNKEKLTWKQNTDSLVIQKPGKIPNDLAVVFKIYL